MPRWNPLQPPEGGLPPAEVRFLDVHIEPWSEDWRKVRVHLQITPFLERPNIEVIIKDPQEEEVASIYIVESIDDRMVFTMHIRSPEIIFWLGGGQVDLVEYRQDFQAQLQIVINTLPDGAI